MGNQVDNKFTWVIKDFSSQQSKRIYSDEFLVDGCKWRLLAYPKGNGVKQQLSLYLAVAGSKDLPIGWRRNTYFRITIVNQPHEEELSHTRDTQHWFDASTCEWGFTSMFALNDLHKNKGYLVNGELKIVAEIYVLEVIGESKVSEDSEEKTKALRKIEKNDTDESNDLHKEASAVKECMDVNGFRVLPSQVETVHCIFERHPSMASEFPKNQHLRSSYMNVLLSVIETMRQSTQEISKYDLADANDALAYLTDVGLNVKWLEEKLEKVTEKKEMKEAVETRMQGIEKELKELKLKCSNLEAQLEKERAVVSAAEAPLTLNDVV